jgi:hypothetical protein
VNGGRVGLEIAWMTKRGLIRHSERRRPITLNFLGELIVHFRTIQVEIWERKHSGTNERENWKLLLEKPSTPWT